ncbi:MAG: hypothetical protein KatS3mg107_0110 [Gemmataceae bacterium]|nr:MAG: hypothetical protein KatS3mg107_0110 [Gemmataceae bacterium]
MKPRSHIRLSLRPVQKQQIAMALVGGDTCSLSFAGGGFYAEVRPFQPMGRPIKASKKAYHWMANKRVMAKG